VSDSGSKSAPIRLARPDVGEAELDAVREVIATGQLTMGPKVEEFESALAHAVGTSHAAVVSSGTAALHLALLALEIGPGDEVIVPAYTFPATANVVELCGARALLVDIDSETFVVDPAAVAAAMTPNTRAVMAVHLFGRPVDPTATYSSFGDNDNGRVKDDWTFELANVYGKNKITINPMPVTGGTGSPLNTLVTF